GPIGAVKHPINAEAVITVAETVKGADTGREFESATAARYLTAGKAPDFHNKHAFCIGEADRVSVPGCDRAVIDDSRGARSKGLDADATPDRASAGVRYDSA